MGHGANLLNFSKVHFTKYLIGTYQCKIDSCKTIYLQNLAKWADSNNPHGTILLLLNIYPCLLVAKLDTVNKYIIIFLKIK